MQLPVPLVTIMLLSPRYYNDHLHFDHLALTLAEKERKKKENHKEWHGHGQEFLAKLSLVR
jgi:hypothetical protein